MSTMTPPDVVPEIESYFAGLHIQLLPAVPMLDRLQPSVN